MTVTEPPQGEAAADQDRPESSPDTVLDDALARAEQHRSDFLRAIAELENFRKRSAREIDAARQFGVERFAAGLLPVADSLSLALEAGTTANPSTLLAGQQATLRLLHKAFEQAGIEAIDPVGQPFDPALHEAMATQLSAEHPPHTVLQVVQRGYLLNGRLLRPARVIVSTEPETRVEPPPDG